MWSFAILPVLLYTATGYNDNTSDHTQGARSDVSLTQLLPKIRQISTQRARSDINALEW